MERDAEITMRLRLRADVHIADPPTPTPPCLTVSDRGDASVLASQGKECAQLHVYHSVRRIVPDHLF